MSTCILTRSVFNPGVRVEYNDELHADPHTSYEEWVWPFPIPEEERDVFLDKVLGSLTEKQTMVVILRFYGEMSFEEISDQMGIHKTSAYDLFQRAIVRLKSEAEEWFRNGEKHEQIV
jgi:DNA-directed RNA polymerase specialized sigma24 family protein